MSLKEFGERLQTLRRQQEAERSVKEEKAQATIVAREKTEQLVCEAAEKKRTENIEILQKDLETFKPIFEAVNESYLEGNGHLWGEIQKIGPTMTVGLSWGQGGQERDSSIQVSRSIGLETEDPNKIELRYGVDGREDFFIVRDKKWKKKLLHAIETALKEDRCYNRPPYKSSICPSHLYESLS